MEADFNRLNKTVYGIRMLEHARRNNLMPEEVFSEHNKMADNGALTKVIPMTSSIRCGGQQESHW